MDFFAAQHQALRKSRWLVFWFVLAVIGIIALVYLPATLIWLTHARELLEMVSDPVLLKIFAPVWVSVVFASLAQKKWPTVLGIIYAVLAVFFLALGPVITYLTVGTGKHDGQQRPRVQHLTIFSVWESGQLWDGERFFWISLLVGGGIAAASLYRTQQISEQGGALIAKQLGGRMIARDTRDLAERRLLNVIDEMAIAAGIPAPAAFVLDEETGLNAFAAGLSTRDNVIAVTSGLLEAMNRDELQGVIGHEISHIVHGDSRLNLELIGVLYGISVLALMGRGMTHGAMKMRGKSSVALVATGLILYAIGYVGVFFGGLIQAAVSREREYLADAAAVQFTRNPDGLAGALEKLQAAGSRIQHPQAAAASHLFFGACGSASAFWGDLLATHPPLADRIRRLVGRVPWRSGVRATFRAKAAAVTPRGAAVPKDEAIGLEEVFSGSVAQAQALLAGLPAALRQQAQGVIGATGIIGGLFFSPQADIRLEQEKQLPAAALPTARELSQWLASQPERGAKFRLVWLGLILPVLHTESEAGRRQLLDLAAALIRAGGRMSPSQFALYSLLRGALLPPAARRVKRGELRAAQLDQDIAGVLALIAHAGQHDPATVQAAYQAAIACSPATAPPPLPAKTELSLAAISQALARLALTAPPYRKKLLDACAVAIRYDGIITPVENELLRAFAQSLDCPAPLTTG